MTKFCMSVDIHDLITYATFGDDRLRGFSVARGRISHFPIDLRRCPYNTLALPCECVMYACMHACLIHTYMHTYIHTYIALWQHIVS